MDKMIKQKAKENKLRKLTFRQQKFVKKTIETLNPTEAVRQSYNLGGKKGKQLENTANSIASENLRKPNIVKAFQDLLGEIKDEEILNRITEILRDADKRSSLTAADMLLKLKDRFPAGKLKIQAYNEELEGLTDGAIDRKTD